GRGPGRVGPPAPGRALPGPPRRGQGGGDLPPARDRLLVHMAGRGDHVAKSRQWTDRGDVCDGEEGGGAGGDRTMSDSYRLDVCRETDAGARFRATRDSS